MAAVNALAAYLARTGYSAGRAADLYGRLSIESNNSFLPFQTVFPLFLFLLHMIMSKKAAFTTSKKQKKEKIFWKEEAAASSPHA